MTSPQDPFAAPDQGGPPQQGYGSPPAPGGGQPPAFGDAPGFGQPPAYGSTPYGTAPADAWQGPPLAGWWSRVGAALLDGLIILVAMVPLLIVAGVTGGFDTDETGTPGSGGPFLALAYLAAVALAVYNLIRQGRQGQSFGKSALKISLRREDNGEFIGGGRSVLRYILHIVDQVPFYIGYLWPLWDKKKQTFADKIMKTVVIKL